MKYKHIHPFSIVNNLYKFAFLFIIPLIQQILTNINNLEEISNIFFKNITIAILIFSWSYAQYHNTRYYIVSKKASIKTGVFFKHNISFKKNNISYITIKDKLFSSLLNCINISFGCISNTKNITLNLNKKDTLYQLSNFFNFKKITPVYQSKLSRVFLMSIFWANPMTSFLVAIPFLQKLEKLLGKKLSEKLYSAVDLRLILISAGISPFIASIIYLLLVAFLIAFSIQFFKYSSLLVKMSDEYIVISHGFFNKTEKIINRSKISAISIEQTTLMKTLNLYNVHLHILNFLKKDENKKLMFAATKNAELTSYLKEIVPIKIHSKKDIILPKEAFSNYLFIPISLFLTLIFFLNKLNSTSTYNQIIFLILNLVMLFLAWWIYFRILAFKHCGLHFYNGYIKICTYNKLTLQTSFFPANKIQCIKITQSPLQRSSNLATIKIYTNSNKEKYFICKHLKINIVKNFVENVKNYFV